MDGTPSGSDKGGNDDGNADNSVSEGRDRESGASQPLHRQGIPTYVLRVREWNRPGCIPQGRIYKVFGNISAN